MAVPKFDPKELKVVGEKLNRFGVPLQLFDFPCTPREAYRALYERKAVWQVTGLEYQMFAPRVNPDNVARAMVVDGSPFTEPPHTAKDMFGLDWEYVPTVGGSIIHPGNPLFEDANDWEKKIVWPDVDSWDWAKNAEENKSYLDTNYWTQCWFQNGWFERLISFMDFENALVALIDDDQQDAVKAFMDRLATLYIDILDRHFHYFPNIDEMYMHDDWGAQKETFFSPALCEELIVPSMRRVTDFIHSKGKFAQLHSCGNIGKQVPNMIAAGWDAWSGQPMNDSHAIYAAHGDKILIGVSPEEFDPANDSEERQREVARNYSNAFCQPNKPSYFGMYWNNKRNGAEALTSAFREELYMRSRENYGK